MLDEIEKAIELLAKKIKDNTESGDALKFSQAALNLAHTKIVCLEAKKIAE